MNTLDAVRKEHEDLERRLASPGARTLHGSERSRLTQRHAELRRIVDIADELQRVREDIAEHEETLQSGDEELRALAAEELPSLRKARESLEAHMQRALNPPDPREAGSAIVEIRAGTGGEEAALFAADLFAMYAKYAERQGWTVHTASTSRSDQGGVREAIAEIRGMNVYGTLRHESGVHRVQRIPKTEKSGRVHTSTATVAVLPAVRPEEMELRAQDLRVDTFRASGHGGQSVQKTESAVRVTHLPTGLVVTCQDERSQHANKEQALNVLRARLLALREQKRRDTEHTLRRAQIGTGDRSEKIRTYNFPQDRVTDHRIKQSWYHIEDILAGDLDQMVEALLSAAQRHGPSS